MGDRTDLHERCAPDLRLQIFAHGGDGKLCLHTDVWVVDVRHKELQLVLLATFHRAARYDKHPRERRHIQLVDPSGRPLILGSSERVSIDIETYKRCVRWHSPSVSQCRHLCTRTC